MAKRSRKKKPTKRLAPERKKPVVKKVILPRGGVVRVVAPEGHSPVAAVTGSVVDIVPVPAAKVEKPPPMGWVEYLFGRDK